MGSPILSLSISKEKGFTKSSRSLIDDPHYLSLGERAYRILWRATDNSYSFFAPGLIGGRGKIFEFQKLFVRPLTRTLEAKVSSWLFQVFYRFHLQLELKRVSNQCVCEAFNSWVSRWPGRLRKQEMNCWRAKILSFQMLPASSSNSPGLPRYRCFLNQLQQ